jgi:tripartite-type tricarboxylate transporter receptor subunit TctC
MDGQPQSLIAGDTGFAYGGMAWDPTGQQLAFQQISRTDPEAGPQIVVRSAAGGGLDVVADDARSAGWLP